MRLFMDLSPGTSALPGGNGPRFWIVSESSDSEFIAIFSKHRVVSQEPPQLRIR
jgi:hypothetical protein